MTFPVMKEQPRKMRLLVAMIYARRRALRLLSNPGGGLSLPAGILLIGAIVLLSFWVIPAIFPHNDVRAVTVFIDATARAGSSPAASLACVSPPLPRRRGPALRQWLATERRRANERSNHAAATASLP
jgi:hypothetical protein